MSTFQMMAASILFLGVAACSAGETTAPTDSALTNSPSPDKASSSTSSSGSGSSSTAKAGSTAKSGSTGDDDDSTASTASGGSDSAGPCAPLIGKWKATFDQGAEATGDDIPIGSISISGEMNFTLTHDDADLPNVVDMVGTATITALGQTQTYQLQPATQTTGDSKDTTCAGGLHFKGAASVDPLGDIVFTMDGNFDGSSAEPTSGTGTFAIKSAADNGQGLTASGPAHLTRQP